VPRSSPVGTALSSRPGLFGAWMKPKAAGTASATTTLERTAHEQQPAEPHPALSPRTNRCSSSSREAFWSAAATTAAAAAAAAAAPSIWLHIKQLQQEALALCCSLIRTRLMVEVPVAGNARQQTELLSQSSRYRNCQQPKNCEHGAANGHCCCAHSGFAVHRPVMAYSAHEHVEGGLRHPAIVPKSAPETQTQQFEGAGWHSHLWHGVEDVEKGLPLELGQVAQAAGGEGLCC